MVEFLDSLESKDLMDNLAYLVILVVQVLMEYRDKKATVDFLGSLVLQDCLEKRAEWVSQVSEVRRGSLGFLAYLGIEDWMADLETKENRALMAHLALLAFQE